MKTDTLEVFLTSKPKCTAEQKVQAVEDYLNGVRGISIIMNDLSIASTRTIQKRISVYQISGIYAFILSGSIASITNFPVITLIFSAIKIGLADRVSIILSIFL